MPKTKAPAQEPSQPGQASKKARSSSPSVVVETPNTSEWDGKLPGDDSTDDAWPILKKLIPDVKMRLAAALTGAGCTTADDVASTPPLPIKESLAKGELASFKDPWDAKKCMAAVRTTGVYEAGCNVFWLSWDPDAKLPFELPVVHPSWRDVNEIYTRLFSDNASGLVGVTPDAHVRIYFPVPLPAFVLDEVSLSAPSLPSMLHLSAGHTLVYAWFLGVWHALTSGDQAWLLRLWEAGLTASVRMRLVKAEDPRAVLLDSWSFNEAVQAVQLALGDSFIVFADKLHSFTTLHKKQPGKHTQDSIVKHLALQGVRFRGAALNTTMYKMATTVRNALDENCRACAKTLEWRHGLELLSGSYNKLGRLVQCTQKASIPISGVSAEEGLLFVLQMMDLTIQTGQVRNSKFFTLDVMDKQRDGTLGWLGMTMNKFKFLRYVQGHVLSTIKGNDSLWRTLSEDLLPTLSSPVEYYQYHGQDTDMDAAAGVTAQLKVAVATAELPPAAIQLRDLLVAVYQGTYDAAFKVASPDASMADIVYASESSQELTPLKDALNSFQRAAQTLAVVSASNETESGGPHRLLKKNDSTCSVEDSLDTARERAELWQRIQRERKKFVQIHSMQRIEKKCVEEAWASCGVRTISVGKENHRAFVCSMDLLVEHSREPWLRMQGPGEQTLKTICDWMKEIKGAYDFIILFDGRNRESLTRLRTLMSARNHMTELLLLYSAGSRGDGARTRKVAFGASNFETILVFPPSPRTAFTAKARTHYNALGESSTHDTTYSGVPFRTLSSMPRISASDKAIIMGGASPPGVPEPMQAVCPNPVLFWQECKPTEFLEQFLADLDIHSVFDLSPGSGAMAEACLRLGVVYAGVTAKAEHARWLQNVADRCAVKHVITPGRPLYMKDHVDTVRKHFDDIIQAFDGAAEAEEIDIEKIMEGDTVDSA